MNKFQEKKARKYVIATLDTPTMYIHSLRWSKYELTSNIELATKALSRGLAKDIKGDYLRNNPYEDLVIIPVEITYELINEEEGDE